MNHRLLVASLLVLICFSTASLKAQIPLSNDGALISIRQGALMSVHGDAYNLNDGTFYNTDTLALFQDWINEAGNEGFTTTGSGVVRMMGEDQRIRGIDVTRFFDLRLENTGIKFGDLNVLVDGFLRLNDLEFSLDTNVVFVFNPELQAVTTAGGFVSSLEDGGLERHTDQATWYLFPVGSSNAILRYRPLELFPLTAQNSAYRVRMAHVDATNEGFDRELRDSIICLINPYFYHRVYPTSGMDTARLRIYYDPSTDGPFDSIGHWQNLPQWELTGGVNAGLDPVTGLDFLETIPYVNDFTYPAFGLATVSDSIPIIAQPMGICDGSLLTISAPSGYNIYDFYVNNALTQTGPSNELSGNMFTQGDAIYVIAKDDNCVYPSDTVQVTVYSNSIDLMSSAMAVCDGDPLTFTATPGFNNYSFFVNGNLVQDGINGVYLTDSITNNAEVYVIGTDDFCDYTSDTLTIQVYQNAVDLTVQQDTVCVGDSFIFSATSGFNTYDYQVNGNSVFQTSDNTWSTPLNNLDTVTVSATDDFCTYLSPPIVVHLYLDTVTLTLNADTLCAGETFEANATSGFLNYDFYVNGVPVQSGPDDLFISATLEDGDELYVNSSDANCTYTSDTLSVYRFMNDLDLMASTMAICPEDSIRFTGSSDFLNYDFYWNDNLAQSGEDSTFLVTGFSDGDSVYAIGTDENCDYTSDTLTITVYDNTLVLDVAEDTLCVGESFEFSATGGFNTYDFQVNGVSVFQSADSLWTSTLINGDTIQVIAMDDFCTGISNEIVVYHFQNEVTLTVNADTLCAGEAFAFNASAGFDNYEFYVNGNSVQAGPASSYFAILEDGSEVWVLATDENCTYNSDSLTVSIFQNDIQLTSPGLDLCPGDTASFQATPGFLNYDFFVNEQLVQSGTSEEFESPNFMDGDSIWVIGTDQHCDYTSNQLQVNVTNATLSLTQGPAVPCIGDTLLVLANADFDFYNFFVNGTLVQASTDFVLTIEGLGPGDEVNATATLNGCPFESNMLIPQFVEADLQLTGPEDVCPVGPVTYVASEGFTNYEFFQNGLFVQTGDDTEYSILEPETGDSTYVLATFNGCVFQSNALVVNLLDSIDVSVSDDVVIPLGGNTQLVAEGADFYSWEPSTGLSCDGCAGPIASPEVTTSYIVTGENFDGCSDTAQVTVTVIEPEGFEPFIPNAFTPNGDGKNDVWRLRFLDNFPENSVTIINRWGDVIFEDSPYTTPFDGTWDGRQLPRGTYYYIIRIRVNNEFLTYKGPLTIIL